MDVSPTDNKIREIENRLLRIEEYLFPPGGLSLREEPTGPLSPLSPYDELNKKFDNLNGKLDELVGRFATRTDLDELKRVVARMREEIVAIVEEKVKEEISKILRSGIAM